MLRFRKPPQSGAGSNPSKHAPKGTTCSIFRPRTGSVAHNPVSNMILASGVCPVPELRRLGVNVGIGVDGPASNNRQDMLEAIKLAPLLQRVDRLQATALSARDALTMATIEGARRGKIRRRRRDRQRGPERGGSNHRPL